MTPSLLFPPVLASLRGALDQPVFPGKIVVWLLFMLSIVGWVMMISKILQLRKSRRSDLAFTERLRRSKTTLEVFEEGWEDEHSLKHLVYQCGARETAFQLLGTREPQEMLQHRLRQAGKLSSRQLEFLRSAFHTGYRTSLARLRSGIGSLRLVAAAAILLSAFGFIWTLMAAFDGAGEFAETAPRIAGALGFLALGLLVAGPAAFARLALLAVAGKRKRELERFRDDIQRLFERSFASLSDPAAAPPATGREASPARVAHASPSEGPAPKPGADSPAETGEEKKRYHSIRDRLLRSEEEEEETSPFRVNPIARQAASAGGGLRGY